MRHLIRYALLLVPALSSLAVAAGEPWQQYEDPAATGWSTEQLALARAEAESVGSASVMLVDAGTVVFAWGEVSRQFPLYSMRKGLYNALYGIAYDAGRLELDATLAELGIDDHDPLTESEKSATVEDLLSSRSGVYHPSAYEPGSMKRNRPARGSHAPGSRWFYNNWDFNTALAILEKVSGHDAARLFREAIAAPLEMEDFDETSTFSFLEPSTSLYPALVFKMSARDLARVGQLYLERGSWQGDRIVSEEWIEKSWTPHTLFDEGSPFGEGNGFGYLWWFYDGDDGSELLPADLWLTRGSDGQVLAVVPDRSLVFVHQTDTENGRAADFVDAIRILSHLIRAQPERRPSAEIGTVELGPDPLPGAQPAPIRRKAMPWTASLRKSLEGEWIAGGRVPVTVHSFDGRLFARPRGVPLAEAELFAETPDKLFSPAVDVLLEVVRDDEGWPVKLVGRVDGMPMEITRSERRTEKKH